MMGDDDDLYLLATDAGYGFLVEARRPPDAATAPARRCSTSRRARKVLPPLRVLNPDTELLAAATDAGRLLIFPLNELPLLPSGKGVKILNLPAKGEPSP